MGLHDVDKYAYKGIESMLYCFFQASETLQKGLVTVLLSGLEKMLLLMVYICIPYALKLLFAKWYRVACRSNTPNPDP